MYKSTFEFLRGMTQKTIIFFIKLMRPFVSIKIIWFSRFMATDKRYICFDRHGLVYILNTKDYAVSRKIYIGRQNEHLKVIKAIDWVQQYDRGWIPETILDIGANVGHISIPLLKNNIFNKAIGFEPERENYKLFKANVIMNDLGEKIDTFNCAIGVSDNQELEFELSDDNFGDHRVRVSESDGSFNEVARTVVKVASHSLDSFEGVIGVTKPMIWIDVQGYEGAVLKGARRLMEQLPPIGIEFWPYGMKRAATFDDLFESLLPYRYYFDLDNSTPVKNDIGVLKDLYVQHQNDDSFYFDILVLNTQH